jgi:hypothetical protein
LLPSMQGTRGWSPRRGRGKRWLVPKILLHEKKRINTVVKHADNTAA